MLHTLRCRFTASAQSAGAKWQNKCNRTLTPTSFSRLNASLHRGQNARQLSVAPSWATVDPDKLGDDSTPYFVANIVDGEWQQQWTKNKISIPNPIDKNSSPIFTIPDTSKEDLCPFVKSMEGVTKSGLHNPLKNVERYLMYGEVSRKVSHL